MSNVKDFLKRKDIVITPQRYLIEALGAMAQGLFASLLIGTIIKTLGQQTGLETLVDLGGYATAMSGPAMAVAIGWALHCPPLVLFSLVTVGYSSNALGGAGGPLAVLIIAIVAAELGKAVSKETRVDILVTPLVTIFAGVGLSMLIAAPIGAAASQVGTLIMWATEQAPFLMGILVSVIVGVALTLPISSAAICAALGLTGLAGAAAVAAFAHTERMGRKRRGCSEAIDRLIGAVRAGLSIADAARRFGSTDPLVPSNIINAPCALPAWAYKLMCARFNRA